MFKRANYFLLLVSPFFMIVLLVAVSVATAHDAATEIPCPPGTLLEPYSGVCASINDVRDFFTKHKSSSTIHIIPNLTKLRNEKASILGLKGDGMPVPGGLGAGTIYKNGSLQVLERAELHTEMFVYPNGVNPSQHLEWLFTTATNRTDKTIEVAGIYSDSIRERGHLGIWDWSCSVTYPCLNGDTEPSWQWTRPFSDFECNLTKIVDKGGHPQTVIQYANMSVKMDEANPPLWWNQAYLWNFCNNEWDLVYGHQFRYNQHDCSIDNLCGWWGPILETFGESQPEINELGFEDTLLFHDGTWSYLLPSETDFINPVPPWVLFHLDPNRGFGAGNYVSPKPAPDISVTPTSYDFGSVIVGSTSAPETFTISNTGGEDLMINEVSTGTNPTEFSIQNDNCSGQTVVSLSNCSIQVVFSPTSAGTKSANLSISSNDPDTALLNVQLLGIGSIVMLLTPNGGEVIPSGSAYNIQWMDSAEVVKFKLTYSLDNGLTWIPIPKTADFITSTSYDWTVPKPWGNQKNICLVKVKGYDALGMKVGVDTSDAPFTIEVVKLTSPNGGVTYISGNPLTITWTSNATKRDIAKVKLYYTKDGGITWYLIDRLTDSAYLTKGPHSYPCTVPTVAKIKNNCKIRAELIDADGNILGKDASDSYFTIQQ